MLIRSVIFLLIWGFALVIAQSEGESCTPERSNLPGICSLVSHCPSVLNNILISRPYTKCSYKGKVTIVCCPVKVPTTTQKPCPGGICSRRLHEEKCEEYKSAVYNYILPPISVPDSVNNRISLDKCGHKHIPLIVGGTLANAREFPHMALVGFDNECKWQCGGTLISDRYVLTAGHCLFKTELYKHSVPKSGEPKYVRLGDLIIDSEEDDAKPEDYNIEELILHPKWNSSSNYNDIGLLKLDRNVELSPYKRPACLPTHFNEAEIRYIATGWGKTNWTGSGSTHLQKVTLDKFTYTECSEIYASQKSRQLGDGIRDDTQMCAGSKDDNKDTCQGDSGGPLQKLHDTQYCMYTVIGITSLGITCGNKGVPGVYTRVFPYVDWIENVVWKN